MRFMVQCLCVTDLRFFSLQFELPSPPESSFSPGSLSLLSLRSRYVKWDEVELSAEARSPQQFSVRLQWFSLEITLKK